MTNKYTLTPEHREQLKPWAERWIANAMSTKPMDDHDRAEMRKAIKGLYEAAGLVPPPEHRIVFVPSPFVARFAGGFAASIWATRAATDAATADATRAATYDATYYATADATDDATDAATAAATYAATYAATRAATDAATYDATEAATRAATRDATRAATYAATYAATADATYDATRAATYAATYAATDDATADATYDATYDATADATEAATRDATEAATRAVINKNWYSSTSGFIAAGVKLKVGKFGFECAIKAWRMYQGGNFWSAYDCFLSFFRHVAKLPIDYSKYDHWEKAAIHGSYRIMHPDFCIVSDRPVKLKVDEQNRPHCEDGPYCEWSDGMKLYAWHGTRVPEYWFTHRHLLTAKEALRWENLEQRRAACEMLGWANILKELDAKTINHDDDPQIGHLVEVDLPDIGRERFLIVECGTKRTFALPVPPDMKTALQANSWTYGLDPSEFNIEVRT